MRALRSLALGSAALVGLAGLAVVSPVSAGAVEVGDAAALEAAFADVEETEIVLTADITIPCDDDPQMYRSNPEADLVIDGAGHTITFGCDGGAWSLFVLSHDFSNLPDLTLRDLTVVDTGTGMSVAWVDGELFLDGVETEGWWDVLRADEITVDRSYLHDGDGGSAVQPDASATVRSSTIEGFDIGVEGAGNGEAPIVVENSTITGMAEAGVQTRSTVTTLTHVTFADNEVHLQLVGGSLTTTASAYGASGSAPCAFDPTLPATTSGGHNVVVGTCGFSGTGDVEGASAADLALGALAGSPLPVLTPGAGSILVDAVPAGDCALATDELGTARPQGGGCEVGAVEVVPETPPTTPPDGPNQPAPTPPAAPAPAATPTRGQPTFTG